MQEERKGSGREQQHTTPSSHNPKTWSTAEGMGALHTGQQPPASQGPADSGKNSQNMLGHDMAREDASAEPTNKAHQALMEPGWGPLGLGRPSLGSPAADEGSRLWRESPQSQGGLGTQPPCPPLATAPGPRWDPPGPGHLPGLGDREPDSGLEAKLHASLPWASASNLRSWSPSLA